MTVDNTKLNYLSSWDIDQLILTDSVAVASGTTALLTLPATVPALPVFEVQLQVSGKYYQSGQFATSNTVATTQSFSAYVQSGVLYITSSTAGIARYFIWLDKVNY